MNLMKQSLLLALTLLHMITTYAQNGGKISGTIKSADATPIEGATISLLRVKDTVKVKQTIVDKNGAYTFEEISNGIYAVMATSAGYRKAFAKVEVTGDKQIVQVAPISLTPLNKELANITITTTRPPIEYKIDRTILNVDASISNNGTSALELLEKSPGVSVDKDGNISLKGKDAVLIMVDGRPTQLSGQDLANLLRNMSSNQLDQIELMTNPPARYNATGTSGIINIKTKKIITAGLNGSASLSYSQGRYPKTAEGFNFNYRNGKTNLFTSLSHNYQKRYSILNIDRNVFNNNTNTVEKIFNQQANRIAKGNSYSAKMGVDFFATKRTTIGAVVNFNSRDLLSNNPNITQISNAYKDLESITNALVDNETDWNSFSSNLNLRTLLNKKGNEITSDIDFGKHTMKNDLFMVNSYKDAAGNEYKKADSLVGNLPQDIDIYSARIDYLRPLKNNAKFEAGIKSSIVTTDNDAVYDSIQNGLLVHDLNRSNHFLYEENINAAYINLSTPLSKKWDAQLGLRLENTNAKGKQITTGERFDRHYTQLFPTAYFQYKADEKNNIGINIGRRVNRPSYQSLNPFIKFIDRYTFSQGNPALKPSVSTNIEVSHAWKTLITTTLNYTHVKDIINEVIQQKGQEAYNMPANISSLNQFGLSINTNTPVTKWWSSSMNVDLYNNHYEGSISNSSIDRSATSFVINGTQQFKLNSTLAAELNGRYASASLGGVMQVDPVGFIGAGFSQKILKNKGVIRLTARDIFHTQKVKGVTRYDNVDVVMRQASETQILTIGFSYSFSKGKKITPIKRSTGSVDEENNRVGQ